MSDNGKESKKYKYLVTMRWYIETDKLLVKVQGTLPSGFKFIKF